MTTQNENPAKRLRARENADDQLVTGFSFCEFSDPITERSKAKSIQLKIIFDTELKIALRTYT